jgi:hypothetical protein
MADPDIRQVLESRFEMPSNLEPGDVELLEEFLRCDQVLEQFYRRSQLTERPPLSDLQAAADSAIAAYEQCAGRLPVGWQKFLVLQAGIAGCEDNLDSPQVQDWAYARVKEENPQWLGDFDEDVDREMPMRWLTQLIGIGVLQRRQLAQQPPPVPKRRWFGR